MCYNITHSMTVPNPQTKTEWVSLRLEEDLVREIRRIAREEDRTVSAQVRRMLRKALAKDQT